MPNPFSDRLHGIIPPVITPLDDAGNFDRESAERLYAFHLEAGVHGLFLFGSSGEGPLLNARQREQTLRTAVDVVRSRVPILAGVPAPGTEQAITMAKVARDRGADALVVCPPFYFPATQDEVLNHYRSIQKAVGLPIVVYDIPVTTKVKIAMSTMLTLAEEGTIVGLKDSSGDVAGYRRLLAKRPKGFRMMTGSELLVDTVLLMGSDGAVPGLANVDSASFVQLYDHWQAGRLTEAVAIQNKLVRLFDVFAAPDGTIRSGLAIGGMKTAMKLRGIIASNRLCKPFLPVTPEQEARVRGILEEHGLL